MWDFDADFDTDLDLGSRRKPVQWVAVAPPITERTKQQVHKRYERLFHRHRNLFQIRTRRFHESTARLQAITVNVFDMHELPARLLWSTSKSAELSPTGT